MTVLDVDLIATARERNPGTGGTVWLASFPKSGNTWVRAIITGLGVHPHFFAVNQLNAGSQPYVVSGELWVTGIDCRWLDRGELTVLRDAQIRRGDPQPASDANEPIRPRFRKTHEIYRAGEYGREPFPHEATRGALLVVRDPRDVVCSYAPFFGLTHDASIDALAYNDNGQIGSPAGGYTPQPWGHWSQHLMSWLAKDVPFPVHLVRYEDLKADPVGTLLPTFNALGLDCSEEELQLAVSQAAFERLQSAEATGGFAETSPVTKNFFRKGESGGWREELTSHQVALIESDHHEAMTALGYEIQSDEAALRSASEVRESRRRQRATDWLDLPEHMGIMVSRGKVPNGLPGANNPRGWIDVTDDEALVRFQSGAKILVTGGNAARVDVDVDEHIDGDPSWMVQGWAVTLAMLQRGMLSLHAATVRVGDRIVAITGHRGAGKSTTSMALRQRGHALLVDDVTLIEFQHDQAWTTPYPRNVHLLPDAAAAVGLDFDALPVLAGGRAKAAFRAEDPAIETVRIDQIVVLTKGASVTDVEVHHPRGAARVASLMAHTTRDGIAPLVLGQERYFSQLARLANGTPVAVIRRPTEAWSLTTVVEAIESIAEYGTSPAI